MVFPQFRKLNNNKSYYRIDAPDRFVELQQIGKKWTKFEFKVDQFFDLMRVNDMLQSNAPFVLSTRNEFNAIQIDF